MSDFSNHPRPVDADDPFEARRALIATAIVLILVAIVSFGPRRERSKTVAGAPCSVLSEDAISTVLGTPMTLMPTSGTICQYVATGISHPTLIVVARHPAVPPPMWQSARNVPVAHLGDAASREENSLYVRYGSRAYTFNIVAQSDPDAALRNEERLARLVGTALVARTR